MAYMLGVRNDGVAIAKSIRSADSLYTLVGFVSDEDGMENRMLMGEGASVRQCTAGYNETKPHQYVDSLTP